MTTPHQRTLTVVRTRQFLRELGDPDLTPRLPLRIRQRALSLLKHLPDNSALARAADACPDAFGPLDDWTQ